MDIDNNTKIRYISMAQPKSEDVLDEAKDLLAQGKRFMALEDYQSATDLLEQACQLFDSYYGVARIECADAYLEYGLALVALANIEAGTGTEKIMRKVGIGGEDEDENDEDADEDAEEDDEEAEEVEEGENEEADDEEGEVTDDAKKTDEQLNGDSQVEARPESIPTQTSSSHNRMSNGTLQENGTQSKKIDDQPQPSSSKSNDNPQPGTSVGGETTKDDESVENEEATTIEIAWEVLCLAKRLFMTDESLEGRLKLAETLQKLGEISIEWENNDNAVSILEECLKIREAILPPEDRLIALTYYNLGLAHSFKSDVQSANTNFSKAIEVIEKRIATLEKDLEKGKQAQDTVAISTYQREINELKDLLPDMTMRLDDSREDGTKCTEALKRTREEMQQEDEVAKKVYLDNSKPVDDISHLVKRKAN